MKVAHILRKYDPTEWGGTETALYSLMNGMDQLDIESVVFCPALQKAPTWDPYAKLGCRIERFPYLLPVVGISIEQRQRLISIGGNLLSFRFPWQLFKEQNLSIIHTHTFGLIGGMSLAIAKARKIPLVSSIHGGLLDLPAESKAALLKPLEGGFNWGRVFSLCFRTGRVLKDADAVLTCNKREAELLRQKYPGQRVVVHPHAVPASLYSQDYRPHVYESFPYLAGKRLLLIPARIDPVKNQAWVLEKLPAILKKDPNIYLLMAGPVTEGRYASELKEKIKSLGLENHAGFAGVLPPYDPLLIGLFQTADAMVLPSIAEPFGLVILEAWAAGTLPICSRTSGATELIQEGKDGWIFDLSKPADFLRILESPKRDELAARGKERVAKEFDVSRLAKQMQTLYEDLIEAKKRR